MFLTLTFKPIQSSYFSPLLKSIAKPSNVDYVMIEEDPEEREEFISILEARFFFLAADARSSLSEGSGSLKRGSDSLEAGLSPWKVQAFAALGRGAEEFITMILKGGGMFTVGRLYNLISSKLSGKVFLEAANYQIKNEVLKEGGRLAAINLESRAALLAAKQGLKGAASRYLGVRSIMVLLGPMLWGTFLADLVIQMLGTDYARILRAIYAFAQIRISRTYRLPADGS
ncbi:hypothetical protein M8C21_024371 [Ambrosia artemisiifolia]|uniref:Uncharacterized protein n=1 Tax=Ambrosia artemisiifolia TaxID=4212 RepID=A0AAD5CXC3_AMBAR|nr:hypothetical protein M8C21_024371 [Ambrosia artemisiifolia]